MAEAYLTRRTSRVKRGEVVITENASLTIPDLIGMKNAVISFKSNNDLGNYLAASEGFAKRQIIEIIIEDGKVAHIAYVSTEQNNAPSYMRVEYSKSSLVITFDASTGTINVSLTYAYFDRGTTYKYIIY
jgi:hypothetical protein